MEKVYIAMEVSLQGFLKSGFNIGCKYIFVQCIFGSYEGHFYVKN